MILRRVSFLFIIGFSLIMGACSEESSVKDNQVLHIEPAELFRGDAAILEPHLGINGGAAKVTYEGDGKVLKTKYELWENGKVVEERDSLAVSINKPLDGEVSVSLKEEPDDENQFKVTVAVTPGGSARFSIPKFNENYGYSPIRMGNPFDVAEGEEAIIWGLSAHKNGTRVYFANPEKQAHEADWAFLLKISVGEGSNRSARND
ncbi:MAG: hypothetical protein H0Z33_03345 [Bacillaceae bacterium]|nr:hypothetical protein [Bacillaceae bacterium]